MFLQPLLGEGQCAPDDVSYLRFSVFVVSGSAPKVLGQVDQVPADAVGMIHRLAAGVIQSLPRIVFVIPDLAHLSRCSNGSREVPQDALADRVGFALGGGDRKGGFARSLGSSAVAINEICYQFRCCLCGLVKPAGHWMIPCSVRLEFPFLMSRLMHPKAGTVLANSTKPIFD